MNPLIAAKYNTYLLPFKRTALLACVYVITFLPMKIQGQTIRDEVNTHVKDNLNKEKNTPKKKTKKKSKKKPKKKTKKKTKKTASSTKPIKKTKATKTKSKLPKRIFHKALKIDLITGVGYRGWAPQQYPSVNVNMGHYFTWTIGGQARLFNLINISKLHYESNAVASPRISHAGDAAKFGSYAIKAAWFLAEFGIPILDRWEPIIHYETRNFKTTAQTKGTSEVCVIPFEQDTDVGNCEATSGKIGITSSFESAVLGLRYFPGKDPNAVIHHSGTKAPSFLIGAAYMSYVKPYQVTIGDAVLDKYLFTGRFYGGGLAIGAKFGGGVNQPSLNIWTQFGLGRVRLTKDMTLNELAPKDWLIEYAQGNATLQYKWAPFNFAPTLLIVPSGTVSGAGFFFFETNNKEDEETATPLINWDLLYTVRLAFIMTF